MKKVVLALSILSSLFADIYTQGENFYFQKGCNSCHGLKGEGLHEFPKLANKNYDDLINRLNAYRADQVKTPTASIMTRYAKVLNEEEMSAIAYFLSNFVEKEEGERYDIEYEPWGDGGS